MSNYLLVAEEAAPIQPGDQASSITGLAAGLAARHRVSVLSLAPVEAAAVQPGLARRLRTVPVTAGGLTREYPLFEGRASALPIHRFVLGAAPVNRGEACALLEGAAAALVRDEMAAADVVVAWSETAVEALGAVPATTRIFALPEGRLSPPLSDEEFAAFSERSTDRERSLAARGVAASTTIVVPSPSAAAFLEASPELAKRAADQQVVPIPFGCDDPPFDPKTDPALEARYEAADLSGKAACRKALARRLSLTMGPRTLMVATSPLALCGGARPLLRALQQVGTLDIAVVIRGGREQGLVDQATVLAIEQTGKVAVLNDDRAETTRQLLAGADAWLLAGEADPVAREAGVALRYGTLPIAPNDGANADYLVDFDARSGTGTALLYRPSDEQALVGGLRRAIGLRGQADRWPPLVGALMEQAPRWARAAALLDALRPPE
jgi:hypothetical protein